MFTLYAKAFSFKPSVPLDLMLGLPEISRHKTIQIQTKHCKAYNELVNWHPNLSALVHPNYIQTLSLPLQLDMMVDKTFPFKPLGLVHLANQINCHKLPEQSATLNISTEFGRVFMHKKGWLFEVITNAVDPDNNDSNAFSAISYYLARMKHEQGSIATSVIKEEKIPQWISSILRKVHEGTDADIHTQSLHFDSNIGRKYAKVSGDYNPIHLHPMTAKILGFKKAIAHGMYSKALALSLLSNKLPFYQAPFSINTVFMQPISLPLETKMCMHDTQNRLELEQSRAVDFFLASHKRKKNRLHLYGSIERF